MEVDTGTEDNQYPMNLSISCSRMERTIDRGPLCLLLACKAVSGDTGIITTAIIQKINDRIAIGRYNCIAVESGGKKAFALKVSVKMR